MTSKEALKILKNTVNLSTLENIEDLLNAIEQEDFLTLSYDKKKYILKEFFNMEEILQSDEALIKMKALAFEFMPNKEFTFQKIDDANLVQAILENNEISKKLKYEVIKTKILSLPDIELYKSVLNNENLLIRFDDELINSLVEKYFKEYNNDNNNFSEIDKNISTFASSKKIAEYYQKYNIGAKSDNNKQDNEETLAERFIRKMNFSVPKAALFLEELNLSENSKKTILINISNDNLDKNDSFQSMLEAVIATAKKEFTKPSKSDSSLVRDLKYFSFDPSFCRELMNHIILPADKNIDPRFYKNISYALIEEVSKYAEKFYDVKCEHLIYRNEDYDLETIRNINGKAVGSCNGYTNQVKYLNYFVIPYVEEKASKEEKNIELNKLLSYNIYVFDTIFHEIRHAKQNQKIKDKKTMSALAFSLESILKAEWTGVYYTGNYNDFQLEIDARTFGLYGSYNFIQDLYADDENYKSLLNRALFSPYRTKKFLEERKKGKFYTENFQEILDKRIEDFKEKLKNSKNSLTDIDIRSKIDNYPVLQLVMDKEGNFYNLSEIEEKEKQATSPEDKQFYINYSEYYLKPKTKKEERKKLQEAENANFMKELELLLAKDNPVETENPTIHNENTENKTELKTMLDSYDKEQTLNQPLNEHNLK